MVTGRNAEAVFVIYRRYLVNVIEAFCEVEARHCERKCRYDLRGYGLAWQSIWRVAFVTRGCKAGSIVLSTVSEAKNSKRRARVYINMAEERFRKRAWPGAVGQACPDPFRAGQCPTGYGSEFYLWRVATPARCTVWWLERRRHARPSILRNIFGVWCGSRGVMSRGWRREEES